jgi:hypothetical protein
MCKRDRNACKCCAPCDKCFVGGCANYRSVCTRRPCLGFSLYLSAILLIGGSLTGLGFLLALAGNDRKDMVDKFNAAASAWSSGGYAAFLNLNVTVGPTDNTPPQLTLPAVLGPDSFPDTDSSDPRPAYPAMGVRYTAPATISGRAFTNGGYIAFAVRVNGTESSKNIPLFREKVEKNKNSETRTRQCLSSVCIAVDPVTWRAEDGGCSQGGESDGGAATWDKCSSSGSPTLTVPFTIRSSADPYVALIRFTKGSLNFPLSQVTKLIVGLILFLLCPPLLGLCCCAVRRAPPPPSFAPLPSGKGQWLAHFPLSLPHPALQWATVSCNPQQTITGAALPWPPGPLLHLGAFDLDGTPLFCTRAACMDGSVLVGKVGGGALEASGGLGAAFAQGTLLPFYATEAAVDTFEVLVGHSPGWRLAMVPCMRGVRSRPSDPALLPMGSVGVGRVADGREVYLGIVTHAIGGRVVHTPGSIVGGFMYAPLGGRVLRFFGGFRVLTAHFDEGAGAGHFNSTNPLLLAKEPRQLLCVGCIPTPPPPAWAWSSTHHGHHDAHGGSSNTAGAGAMGVAVGYALSSDAGSSRVGAEGMGSGGEVFGAGGELVGPGGDSGGFGGGGDLGGDFGGGGGGDGGGGGGDGGGGGGDGGGGGGDGGGGGGDGGGGGGGGD